MMKRDFHASGIAGMDRLDEDGAAGASATAAATSRPRPSPSACERDQLDAIKYPADGKFLGDWKSGEKIAQNGRGMTWSDGGAGANGGNCYNCHQIGPNETSFGTHRPQPAASSARPAATARRSQKYVYGKIYNAKAFNLCSNMPRFGHSGTLTEQQIKDLVALLLDPSSPVNK